MSKHTPPPFYRVRYWNRGGAAFCTRLLSAQRAKQAAANLAQISNVARVEVETVERAALAKAGSQP